MQNPLFYGPLKVVCVFTPACKVYCFHKHFIPKSKIRYQYGAVHKRCQNFFGHLWYPPPPCWNSNPDLPKPLPSNILQHQNLIPSKIFRHLLWMAPKAEIFLEQREIAFLSPSKICENLNFSTEIQICCSVLSSKIIITLPQKTHLP